MSNEELQSTNEALETSKEELQVTKEELSTMNDELGNRNLELTRVQIQRQSDEVKRALDQARDARGAYHLLNDRIQKVGDQLDAARPDMLKAELAEIRRLVVGHIESEHSPTTVRSPKAKPRSAKSRKR